MLVLSSPTGAGKTTLSRQLLDNDKQIQLSVSCTTRQKRPGERDGVDYRFVDTATFRGMIERKEFLEYAEVFANYYGTPKAPVDEALAGGRDVTARPVQGLSASRYGAPGACDVRPSESVSGTPISAFSNELIRKTRPPRSGCSSSNLRFVRPLITERSPSSSSLIGSEM